ncbi:MAG: ribonuclease HI, partial [Nitrospiraceae bacterium]|nr:ribonuclease HI [Nitrospiraceae bacterium]
MELYTDGACSGNPGPGGWGALLVCRGTEREISGGDPATTNNRMELMAVIAGLSALKKPCRVTVHTDSQYVKNGMTTWIKGWKKNGFRK